MRAIDERLVIIDSAIQDFGLACRTSLCSAQTAWFGDLYNLERFTSLCKFQCTRKCVMARRKSLPIEAISFGPMDVEVGSGNICLGVHLPLPLWEAVAGVYKRNYNLTIR